MEQSKDWNPDHYLKFRNERTQPSIDLVNRIRIDFTPEYIIDIGCGPGNSSQVLVNRWPGSRLVGIDNSESMIAKARSDYPANEWILADASSYHSDQKFDLVFSNAAIQWMPGHQSLLKNFSELLSNRGVLAIQIPLFWDMPVGKAIKAVSSETHWQKLTEGVEKLFAIHDPSFYYDIMAGLFPVVDMWETSYMHVLESHQAILDMIRSTGLRPYYESIGNEKEIAEFEQEVFIDMQVDYPLQQNGKVLFPFERLFFIGYR